MTSSASFFIALTYLSGFAFPLIAASCGLVALWTLKGFVHGIFNDIRGDGSAS